VGIFKSQAWDGILKKDNIYLVNRTAPRFELQSL
jgi:hypothetical protein